MNNNTIRNRQELVFLYDSRLSNPNGDPMDSNKPRMDEENEINLVTDVRLKRTIRDYLHHFKDMEILVRDTYDESGYVKDAKNRALDFGSDKQQITDSILEKCIDARLFGCVLPLELASGKSKKKGRSEVSDGESGEAPKPEKDSIKLTGPVQFPMGRSLNKVRLVDIKGTGGFASGSEALNKTFRQEYFVNYSLIGFYGIINENAARHTRLTVADVNLLKEAIWQGTLGLVSRSKVGQFPRLLVNIIYRPGKGHTGDILSRLELIPDGRNSIDITDPSEYHIEMKNFINLLEGRKDDIEKIEYIADDRMRFTLDSRTVTIGKAFAGLQASELKF